MLGFAAVGSAGLGEPPPAEGTAPFVLDGNRVYAEISFVRPDGSSHRALAFVDTGSPDMALPGGLFRELKLDSGEPLRFRVGGLLVEIPAKEVSRGPGEPVAIGSELKLEAILPAGVLQRYDVVLDYKRRTITLAAPGRIKPEGVVVPCRKSSRTGVISVDVSVDGTTYPITIDSGSAYTWIRQETSGTWLAKNPAWERGVGAVGASNMTMMGDDSEARGVLLRIPELAIGSLTLKNVGALGAGHGKGPGGVDLFDWYSAKNPAPVIGWIGGNVLKAFRLTIDYANGKTYWLRQQELETSDLNQVGLTLKKQAGAYVVAAVATKNERPTVEGVLPGDKLIQIDGMDTMQVTKGRIYDALHGKPGEVRELVLERRGARVTVRATVTAF